MLKFLDKIDFLLLIPALLLSSLGLLMIYSISFESDPSFFIRQLSYVVFSVIVFFFIGLIDFKSISPFSYLLFFLLLLLLTLTFFFGIEVRGSTRWIDLGFITVQGSEIAKPILLLTLAHFMSRNSPGHLKFFIFSALIASIPVFLVATQPDLSNAVILLSAWVFAVFVSGGNLLYLALFALLSAMSVPLVWNFILKGYQQTRILTFFNPNIDPLGSSYNLVQALIALGSGEFFGRGLGRGTQLHLDFLPEGRTDFIFAAAGEELGFVGISLILVIFAFLIYRLLQKGREVKNIEGSIFIFSTAFILTVQFFINAGMNMGIFPISGVTLPFVSFGGSSIVVSFVLLGLVQSASRDK